MKSGYYSKAPGNGVGLHADGGFENLILITAVRNPTFAKELSAMPNSLAIWHDISTAFYSSPKLISPIFSEWMFEGGSIAFSDFWLTNGATISSISKAALHEK